MKLRKTIRYDGAYKGICFEIHDNEPPLSWTYYIRIKPSDIQNKDLAQEIWLKAEPLGSGFGRKHYDYYSIDLLSNLDFHGGITFYKKEYSVEGQRVVKIGCDYNHDFDQERNYTLENIVSDVKRTIEDFHSKVDYGGEEND